MTSQIQDVDTFAVPNCDAAYHNDLLDGSTLMVRANVNELPATTTIQWRVFTNHNQYSGTDLVASASDVAPDLNQGL